MSIHTLAFTKLDGAAATDEDIPAVTDNVVTVQNGHYIVQEDMYLLAAYHRNAGAINAKISTPTLRRVAIPSIQPVNVNAAPITLPPMLFFPPAKLTIPAIDEIAWLASNSGIGGIRAVGLLWLNTRSHNFNIPPGDTYTVRFTSTITGTTVVWTSGSISFEQTLPAGRYAVVGLDIIGANTECARLVFLGGGFRPGVVVRPAVSNYMWDYFRQGDSGVFGEFESTALPNLEVFQTTGGAQTYTGFMDLVKIR
jgi:hypothetical protein